jgi:DNA-binding transcriptional MocR family regulator
MVGTKKPPSVSFLAVGDGEGAEGYVMTRLTRPPGVRQAPWGTGFTSIPNRIKDLGLSPREEQLVVRLLSYRWYRDSEIRPSVKALARSMSCSPRTVQRTIARLERRGLLVIDERFSSVAGQLPNVYRPSGALAAILPPAPERPVAAPVDDRRPPMTAAPAKAYVSKPTSQSRHQVRGYTPPARTHADLLMTRYGPLPGRQ